jgi:hypothetical protein
VCRRMAPHASSTPRRRHHRSGWLVTLQLLLCRYKLSKLQGYKVHCRSQGRLKTVGSRSRALVRPMSQLSSKTSSRSSRHAHARKLLCTRRSLASPNGGLRARFRIERPLDP